MPDNNYQPYQPMGSGQPPESDSARSQNDPAVDMIRQKIKQLYGDEPDATQELVEAAHHTHPGSKHQQYMSSLQVSGMSMVDIQSAWHNYYGSLPEHEKYEVWQEFYVQNNGGQPQSPAVQQVQPVVQQVQQAAYQAEPARTAVQAPIADQFAQALNQQRYTPAPAAPAAPAVQPQSATAHEQTKHTNQRVTGRSRALTRKKAAQAGEKASAIKKRIVDTVKTAASDKGSQQLTSKHHFQSALFGLGCGFVVLLIFLFSFFNEVIIAPFIQPSRQANNTPVIVDTASAVIGGGPKVIIPKINLEIPVDYSQTTISNKDIELALDNGVVHYPSTTKPGETGNAAFFGHSSNNIFNPGKYKFAFVLLHELVEGDVFYLNYNDKTYAYKVFKKHIVTPKQVEVLQPIPGKTSTVTLITCDPPGTSINRLVVVGEQISPDPNTNGQPTQEVVTSGGTGTVAAADPALPGNGPSLWKRIVGSIF